MAKRLLDYDPYSGLTTYHSYDAHTGKNTLSYEQDTQHILDAAHVIANDAEHTRRGMKDSMLHYAHLPDIVLLKMKFEDGVDPFNPNNGKAVFDLVNSKYQRLKTTHIVHRAKD